MKIGFRFWGGCVLLLIGCIPSLLAQGNPSLAHTDYFPQNARYWNGKLILKINSAYRSHCKTDAIEVPALQSVFQELGIANVQAIFPQHLLEAQAVNYRKGAGIDLSLTYALQYDTLKLGIEAAVNSLQGLAAIEYVEPWYIYSYFYQPNDFFADTVDGNSQMWHLGPIRAREAWDLQRNDTTITIGIIDSGTSFEHPDLQDNLALNYADPPDGIDNDEDGFVDNYRGWDFGGKVLGDFGDNDPTTVAPWHGIGVAGAAAATADNGLGVVGTGFNCQYLPIKASPESDISDIYYGYQGVVYAVDHGCQIVNLSWGGPIRSRFGEDVVNYATLNRGAAVICAAGNAFGDLRFYPAAYDRCLSVGISTRGDSVSNANTYNFSIDLTSPGFDVASTLGHEDYLGWQGSSISAPLVAGAVALVMGHFPWMNGYQALQRVRLTTDPVPFTAFMEDKVGTGRLNMYRALAEAPFPAVRISEYELVDLAGDGHAAGGDTILLQALFTNHLEATENLVIELSVPLGQSPFLQILDGQMAVGKLNYLQSVVADEQFLFRINPGVPADYYLNVKVQYTDTVLHYTDYEYIQLRINPTWLDVKENLLHTSINSRGNFGFDDYFRFNSGLGVSFQHNQNVLIEGGLLVGTSPAHVADRISNSIQNLRDNDFRTVEAVQKNQQPYLSDFEASARFDDAFSVSNVDLTITQKTFAWKNAPNDHFVIFLYELANETGFPVADIYAGLYADFDLYAQNLNRNRCEYDLPHRVIYTYDAVGQNPMYYGISLLSDGPFLARALGNANQSSYTDAAKYFSISNTPSQGTATAGLNGPGQDVAHYTASGPMSLFNGMKDTVAFGLVAGRGLDDLLRQVEAAQHQYDCNLSGKGPTLPFLISDLAITEGEPITFSDQNSQATQWQWDFGDGNQSSQANPEHSFTQHGTYAVKLTVSDGTCTFSSVQNVKVGFATAIAPEREGAFQLFPNPTDGEVQIQGELLTAGPVRVILRNLHGQPVWEADWVLAAGSFQRQISLPPLPGGLYFFQLWNEQFSEQLLLEVHP